MGCTYGDWRPLAEAKIRLFRRNMRKCDEIEMFKALMPMYDNIFLRYVDSGAIEKLRPALLEDVRESSVRYVISGPVSTERGISGLNDYVSDDFRDFMKRSYNRYYIG